MSITGSGQKIRSKSADIQTFPNELGALEELYKATNGPAWRNSHNWNDKRKPLHHWQGVEVNDSDQHVSKIRLLLNDLSGEIPDAICELQELVYLDLSNNKLVGNIPESISRLSKLRDLKLHYNHLSGPIPDSMGELTSLRGLHMESNQFTGSIPQTLRHLTVLTKLNLGVSQLSGPIPNCILELVSLQELKLNQNNLTGEIPRGLDRLTNLKVLFLNDNKLTGEIPPELGTMYSLRKLHLNNNRLTGSLPVTFRGRDATSTPSSGSNSNVTGGNSGVSSAPPPLVLKVDNNRMSAPTTIAELDRAASAWRAVKIACVAVALVVVYLLIPLVLPFTAGVCLHNHVHFDYAPVVPAPALSLGASGDRGQAESRYKGMSMEEYSRQHELSGSIGGEYGNDDYYGGGTGAPNGMPAAVTSTPVAVCHIPSYCRYLHLQWGFPFILYRTIPLGEVEVRALFDALSGGGSVDRPTGAGTVRRVSLHVMSVTAEIAQIVADAIATNGGRNRLPVSILISGPETVLSVRARAVILDALAQQSAADSSEGREEGNSRVAVLYNGRDVTSAPKVVTLHISGAGYILRYMFALEPIKRVRAWLDDGWSNTGGAAHQQKPPQPQQQQSVASSVINWLSDLVICSLQFDLTNHPRCRGGHRRNSGQQHTAVHQGVPGDDRQPDNAVLSAKSIVVPADLIAFLTVNCGGLSVTVAEQLHSVLGVERVMDLGLLRVSDLSEVLQLPLIPQRKLTQCVCDEALLPLSGREVSVLDRPLCASLHRKVSVAGVAAVTNGAELREAAAEFDGASSRGGEEL